MSSLYKDTLRTLFSMLHNTIMSMMVSILSSIVKIQYPGGTTLILVFPPKLPFLLFPPSHFSFQPLITCLSTSVSSIHSLNAR
jgi:hypothetical protein